MLDRLCLAVTLSLVATSGIFAFDEGPGSAEVAATRTADDEHGRDVIVLGMRTDAMPFSWREWVPGQDAGSRVKPTYRGFLVDICVNAVRDAGYVFRQVPVNASDRKSILAGDTISYDGSDVSVDVLCDPTTITIERLESLADHDFTPIVFVASSSLVTRRLDPGVAVANTDEQRKEEASKASIRSNKTAVSDASVESSNKVPSPSGELGRADLHEHAATEDCRLKVGFVGGTTAEETYLTAVRAGRVKLDSPELNPGNLDERSEGAEEYCPYEAPSHKKGVDKLCDGEIQSYIGDNDIVEAYRALYNKNKELDAPECKLLYRGEPRYEPYALLVRKDDDQFRRRFIRAVYGLFEDSSVEHFFEARFPDKSLSGMLETLFRITAIPSGSAVVTENSGGNAADQIAKMEAQRPFSTSDSE